MKAVVVDLQDKHAVVLDKNGQFIKVKNTGKMQVGYEVELPVKSGFNIVMLSKAASIAAAFLVAVGLGYGAYSYNTPYSYIDIDINPSVEITANRYNYIIKVEALNQDGQKIIAANTFKNENIHKGIEKMLKNAVDAGYISATAESAVMLTVSSKNETKAAEVEKSVQETAEAKVKEVNPTAEVVVEKVSLEKREDARKQDVSPGKLVLIEKLKEENQGIKVEDYKNAAVKDILKTIKDYKKDDIEDKKDKAEKEKQEKEAKKENDKKENDRKEADNGRQNPVKVQPSEDNKKAVDSNAGKKEPEVTKEPEKQDKGQTKEKQQSGGGVGNGNTNNKDEKAKGADEKTQDNNKPKSQKPEDDREDKNAKNDVKNNTKNDNKNENKNDSKTDNKNDNRNDQKSDSKSDPKDRDEKSTKNKK